MRKIVVFISLCLVSFQMMAQEKNYDKNDMVTVVAYNVENLFDTINTPNKNDKEFTPESPKHWNTAKYEQKLRNLSYVLSHINRNELPEIIALEEVENRAVLEDLIKTGALKKGNYKIVHHESPDHRGIDVALLYRSDIVKYVSDKVFPVHFDFDKKGATRDILKVVLKVGNENWNVIVNHWPSRWGGEQKSAPKRAEAAKVARKIVDGILVKNKKAKIMLLGDFNDTPFNKSIENILDAKDNFYPQKQGELYNLMYDKALLGKGTNAYGGKYSMIDNLIVSYPFLNAKSGFKVSSSGVFLNEKITFFNKKSGIWQPNRTYSRDRYYGGYSDHLPIYVILKNK